jgi:hypothetical protein
MAAASKRPPSRSRSPAQKESGPSQSTLRGVTNFKMGFKDENGRWDDAGIQYKDDDLLRSWRLDHVE